MICATCGSPCRDVEGLPRSLVHELTDILAVIEESSTGYAKERAQAAMGMVTAAISAGNNGSQSATRVPRRETEAVP